ncbi:nuclear transport factor 2 family protein [Sorangium sp. So ce1078]|uniref:nuclear transport factor 2 family protein n=1 Tax=Sorangium sp. So ce1078 TaxID=3133329 RepID=UPI003F6422D3
MVDIPLDSEAAARRGRAWASAWNARDLGAVLAHFRDDVTFYSPFAATVLGTPVLRGKEELRRYWEQALESIEHLRFSVERVLWDPAARELAILYLAELDQRRTRACERLRLDEHGQAIEGEALYGAPVGTP